MSVRPILPFLPFPPFRTPGHDMETDNKLCHNKHPAMNAVSECLDKTQIRGYSRDTPANNESYLHTRVMSDTGLAGHYCHTVTLGMIRDNCLVTMFDSYYPESTQ